jgi:hypothetical protein
MPGLPLLLIIAGLIIRYGTSDHHLGFILLVIGVILLAITLVLALLAGWGVSSMFKR